MAVRLIVTERDQEIFDFLHRFHYATTFQLSQIFFKGSLRAAQQRLKLLTDNRHVKRLEVGKYQPYIYCKSGKYSQQIKHHLQIVDTYIELQDRKGLIFEPLVYTRFSDGRRKIKFIADAFIAVPERDFWAFLEIELDPPSKHFSKIAHYEAFMKTKAFLHEWWAEKIPRDAIPQIIVLAPNRSELYKRHVERNRKIKLPWRFIEKPEEILPKLTGYARLAVKPSVKKE